MHNVPHRYDAGKRTQLNIYLTNNPGPESLNLST